MQDDLDFIDLVRGIYSKIDSKRIVILYHDKELSYASLLDVHLAPFKRLCGMYSEKIFVSMLTPEVEEYILNSSVILILFETRLTSSISQNLLMRLNKSVKPNQIILPILLRSNHLIETTPFANTKTCPSKPVEKWRSKDEAFVEIVRTVRYLTESRT